MKKLFSLLLAVLLLTGFAASALAVPTRVFPTVKGYPDVISAAHKLGTTPILQYRFVDCSTGFGGEGGENLWDGDTATKFCTNELPAYSVAYTTVPVSVNGIIMATANDNTMFNGRNPSPWTIYGSADGKTWTAIVTGDGSFFAELDYSYFGATFSPTQKFSYFKFEVTGCAGEGGIFQLSEVVLCTGEKYVVNNGKKYWDPQSAAKGIGKTPLTSLKFSSGSDVFFEYEGAPETPANLWDFNPNTKFCTDQFPAYSIAKAPAKCSIDGIIIATANDHTEYPGRNPKGWQLLGSNDGKTWETIVFGFDTFFTEENFTYFAAAIPPTKEYTWFQFTAYGTDSGTVQVSEVVLCGRQSTAPGQVVGTVLSTDIRAYINGAEIPAYNVDGKLAVLVSDLNSYGFRTNFDNNLRKTSVTRDRSATKFTSVPSKASGLPIGTPVMSVLSTDIKVELDGKEVPAFNVDNRMAIYFSELKQYGEVVYDNATRSSSLKLK